MKPHEFLFSLLIKNENPAALEKIWEQVSVFDWPDENKPILNGEDIISILLRYQRSELSDKQVEDGANFIEAADATRGQHSVVAF